MALGAPAIRAASTRQMTQNHTARVSSGLLAHRRVTGAATTTKV